MILPTIIYPTAHLRSMVVALMLTAVPFSLPLRSPLAIAPAQAQSRPSASVWKVFKSEAGGFSLLLPGDPVENKTDGVISYNVAREQEAVTYTVSYIDFPVDPIAEKNGIQDAFSGVKDGIKEEGGRILVEKPLKLKDFPGEELRVAMPDGATTRVRSYIVGKRLFLVMASTKNERSLMKSLEGFLNSFRVTGAAESTAAPSVVEEKPSAVKSSAEADTKQALCDAIGLCD
jgi:hypothetical protein